MSSSITSRPALLALVLLAALAAPASAQVLGRDGAVPYYGHVFPVQGPHGTRGAIGEFGAPRSGGRTHEGFDVVAACGTELVAVATAACCAGAMTRSSTATTY